MLTSALRRGPRAFASRASRQYNTQVDWKNKYASKIRTAEEAVRLVTPKNRVFMSGNSGVPQQLLQALVKHAPSLSDVEVVQILTHAPADYVGPEMSGHLRVNTLFISANVRSAVQEGRADFTPCFLSQVPHLFLDGVLPLDVAFLQLSPPDEHGFCSFGVEVGVTHSAARVAKYNIAEINPRMPRTLGDAAIHVSKLHALVPVEYELPNSTMHEANHEVVDKIADYVASLIPNGATLQTGIGAVPDAVLRRLGDHRNLGIHSELFSDGVIDLVEKGVINGEAKTIHRGKIVAGFLLGSRRLYDFVDDNPVVEFHPTEYVNDPFVISQNDRMVAINAAIECDLTGQVCADSIGPKFFSGVGGQVDFIYGASRSKGGRPIITMPSTVTKKDGTKLSKIVPMLQHGAGVTTSRNHVHYVVTEHGVATLHGRTISQRVRELVKVAAPEFRDDLLREAKRLNFIQ